MHTDKRIEITKLNDTKNKTIINLPDYVVGQNLLADNPDTVYIFENIHKTLYMLNRNQDIKSLNLNFNNKISDYRFKVKVQLNKNSLYVNAYYFSDHSNINSHTELEREKVKDLSDNERIVVFDNLFSNNICMNQVLINFTNDNILKSNDYVCTENLGLSFTQDYAICFHGNTNVLYVFDKELNNLIKTVELKSRFSSLKVPFVKLFNSEDEIGDFIKNRQEVSFINGVIY
ncbi:MAG: hypothetical protein GX879_09340, partial [Bacteroidales bacterium]|nr:hypothetical protein [Bacteroidales bacterium]